MSLRQGMLDDVGIQQDHVDCASVSDLSTDEEKSYEPPEFLTYSELGVQIEDITSESDELHINTGGFVDCFARRTWAKPSTNEGGSFDLTKNSWIALNPDNNKYKVGYLMLRLIFIIQHNHE